MERSVEVRVFSTAPFDGGMIYADNKEAKSIVDVLLSGAFFCGVFSDGVPIVAGSCYNADLRYFLRWIVAFSS